MHKFEKDRMKLSRPCLISFYNLFNIKAQHPVVPNVSTESNKLSKMANFFQFHVYQVIQPHKASFYFIFCRTQLYSMDKLSCILQLSSSSTKIPMGWNWWSSKRELSIIDYWLSYVYVCNLHCIYIMFSYMEFLGRVVHLF